MEPNPHFWFLRRHDAAGISAVTNPHPTGLNQKSQAQLARTAIALS